MEIQFTESEIHENYLPQNNKCYTVVSHYTGGVGITVLSHYTGGVGIILTY